MKRKLSVISILMALFMCLSSFAFVAYALDSDGDGYDDDTGLPVVDVDPDVDPDPVYTDPYIPPVTEEPYVPPVTEEPYVPPVTEEPYYPPYEEPTYYPVYTFPDNYVEEQQDPIYNYNETAEVPTVPQNTAPSVALYTSGSEISKDELSKNDWDEISKLLMKTDTEESDGEDFNFIKKNTDKGDDGQWMLYTALAMLALGVVGLVYVIGSAVTRRKKFAGIGSSSAADNRTNDDYSDGYSGSKSGKKDKSNGSRYDTSDIDVPKSGGKRFK